MNKSEEKKKIQFAWAFYDWANSVYSLVIATAIFPLYYAAMLEDHDDISFLGRVFNKDEFYTYSITVSFLIVVIISPILSAFADNSGNKKKFLNFFCWLGSLSCMTLFLFTGIETLWLGILASIMASVGFWGSLVFYNAYLPEIAEIEERDALSAKGFSLGYFGSSILLIVCLGISMTYPEYTRYSFIMVGIWWLGFAQYTLRNLPKNLSKSIIPKTGILNAYSELIKTTKTLFKLPNLNIFLIGFFLLSLGIQTVIYTATPYGKQELKLEDQDLIITILAIQFVAILGAYLFSRLSAKVGNIKAIQLGLVVWAIICFLAFSMNAEHPDVKMHFYIIGGLIGLVLGGIQSLARSTYSKLLPQDTTDTTIYFSFFDVFEKIALVSGTFLYGYLIHLTGGMRYSVLSLAIFFVLAIFVFSFVKLRSTKI